MECLIKLEQPDNDLGKENRAAAKMELIAITSKLMPAGKPQFLQVVCYPTIKQLVEQHGRKSILKVIYLMVRDFCSSINVKYNMNEDQAIESAAVLLDECDNFRLEDYQMMFALGKRGQLVEIMHSIDLSVISRMMDEYYLRRQNAVYQQRLEQKAQEKQELEKLKAQELTITTDEKVYTFSDLVKHFNEWTKNQASDESKALSEKYKKTQDWVKNAKADPAVIENVLRVFSSKSRKQK